MEWIKRYGAWCRAMPTDRDIEIATRNASYRLVRVLAEHDAEAVEPVTTKVARAAPWSPVTDVMVVAEARAIHRWHPNPFPTFRLWGR